MHIMVIHDHIKTYYAIYRGFWVILASRASCTETRRITTIIGKPGYNGANLPTIDRSSPKLGIWDH